MPIDFAGIDEKPKKTPGIDFSGVGGVDFEGVDVPQSFIGRALTAVKGVLAPQVQPAEATGEAPDQAIMREQTASPAGPLPAARTAMPPADGLVSEPTHATQEENAGEFARMVARPFARAPIEAAGTAALLTGGLAGLNPSTKTQDTLFKFYDDTRALTAKLSPGADEPFVNKFIDGALGVVPYLATGGTGAAALLANSAARGAEAVKQGIDPETATALGIKDLAMTAIMFKAPMGGNTLVGGAVKGGTVNLGLAIADKALEKGILTAADYREIADKVEIADPEALGQAFGMGSIFGVQASLDRPARERAAALYDRAKARAAKLAPPAAPAEKPLSATMPEGLEGRPEVVEPVKEAPAQPNTIQSTIQPTQPAEKAGEVPRGTLEERRAPKGDVLRQRTQEIIDRAKSQNKVVDQEFRAKAAKEATRQIAAEEDLSPRRTPEDVAAIAALPEPEKPAQAELDLKEQGAFVTKVTPALPMPTEFHTFPGPIFQQAGHLVAKVFNKAAEGLKRGFAPGSLSPEHLQAANTLRQVIGESNRMAEQRAFRLEFPQRAFDKLGVTNKDIPLEDNVGIKTMAALSTGKPLPSELSDNKAVQEYVGARDRIYDDLIKQIRAIDPNALKTIRENYMPGMWTADSRRAFNMAMDEASKQGLLGEGFNVNEAAPDLKRWIRDRTKQLIAEGKGSEPDTGIAYLSKRTLEGRGSFRLHKSFDDVMTGVQFGLEPVSNNPVTLDRLKMAEMQRYLDGNKALKNYQAAGTVKFWSVLKGKPEAGWRIVKDPLMVKYGPPEIETKEYVDKNIYDGLMRVANELGINQERLASAGRGRLGYSVQGGDKIVTQQATELSVLAHELGHQIDYRYNLWDRLVDGAIGIGSRGKITQAAIGAKRATIKNELRSLADLSWEGQEVSSYYKQKVRVKAEKMAHLLEAYVHAPDKMQQVAPTVFADFDAFIKRTPELKSLAGIDAGIALKELTGKKQLGGFPLLGHYVAKEATADILENYLSQSLYNSKIWGPLFKGYMASANELNQFQLTGFFHAGFTTADTIISSNAQLVKTAFNLLGGHAKAGDLKKDILDIKDTLEMKTPAMGGEILRSWLDPTHPASERTKNVIRAIELVGGGSRMENIFRNQDLDKAIADWYGGNKIKAAARTPFAAGELLSKPVLEMLVPRQKFGVFSLFVDRIMRDNPGKPIEALAPQLNEAWNRVDARLGQVRYDRLFMDKTVKNLVQGTFRAPGWTGGTIAELGGALKDTATFFNQWQKTGKLPPMTDRQAYAISLAITTAVINSALQYTMVSIHNMNNPNDKQDPYPESWKDFVAFRTGGTDAQGRKNRFWLPTYAKDVYSWATHPAKTIVNKVNPVLSAGTQLYQNKDYYGNQIYDEQKPVYDPDNLKNLAKYLGEQFVPFTIRAMKEQARGNEPLYERVAPVVGITPAPKYLMQSKAENMAADYVRANLPAGGRTLEEQLSAQARRDIRIGQPGEEDRAVAAFEKGDITKKQFKEILRDAGKKPLERMFSRLTPNQARKVYAVATPEEKELLENAMTRKLTNEMKNKPFKVEDSLDDETKQQLFQMWGAGS